MSSLARSVGTPGRKRQRLLFSAARQLVKFPRIRKFQSTFIIRGWMGWISKSIPEMCHLTDLTGSYPLKVRNFELYDTYLFKNVRSVNDSQKTTF